MEHTLEIREFERLSGPELTRYVTTASLHQGDEAFLRTFIERKNQWDDLHLELGLWWLGKSGSLSAYREIATFIEHPNTSLRFLAIGFILQMSHEVDEDIMSCVVRALETCSDPDDRQTLSSILAKPSSEEAQVLARKYLAS